LIARLLFDPVRQVVFQVPAGGVVRPPRLALESGATRLAFPVDRPEGAWVATRSRAHFRIHFESFFVGALPDTFPEASLVRSIRSLPSATGSAFELRLAPSAAGFRLTRDTASNRVVLVLADRAGEDLEAFAPEGPPGPRALRVVVLDPGHGGVDAGVSASGVVEKELTLSLARMVKAELERRLPARVVLTREDDRLLSLEERAERANRARADLVVSLHFDGFAGAAARGATAWCPPATYASSSAAETEPSTGVAVLTWRDVATRHAVASRELAEDILSSLELRGQGPTRLREVLPSALLGINAPGLMLECATLTSESDRARVLRGEGLAELARGIADGIDAYRRGE
jgi:N-acetylmuramoyl-L-alanine amidase